MKNKRGLFSVILFLGILFLLMSYFSQDNMSNSFNESKVVSEDTQVEKQHRVDAFLNSNVKPSANIISSTKEIPTNNQHPDGEIKNLITEEEILNRECRGGSSDSPETMKYCDKRDAVFTKLDKLGWCFGRDNQAEYEKKWVKCDESLNHIADSAKSDSLPPIQLAEDEFSKSLIMEEEALLRECKEVKGDDLKVMKACDGMQVAFNKLIALGFCFGENSETMADKRWAKCRAVQKNSIRAENVLTYCISTKLQASNGQYSSNDGGKSIHQLLLVDCAYNYSVYLGECARDGRTKQDCDSTIESDTQTALKVFRK